MSITVRGERPAIRFHEATGAKSPFLIGDFSGNLVVDAADLAQWEGAFATNASGDADGDGDSDGQDWLAWQRSLGNEGYRGEFQPTSIAYYATPALASLVPEPALLSMGAWMGAVVLVARGWQRKGRAGQPARKNRPC